MQNWVPAIKNTDYYENDRDMGDGSVRVERLLLNGWQKAFRRVQTQLAGSSAPPFSPPLPVADGNGAAGLGGTTAAALPSPPPPSSGVPIASSAVFPTQTVLQAVPHNIFTVLPYDPALFNSIVSVADMDNDGFKDILVSLQRNNSVVWYHNNHDGTFGAPNVITTAAFGAYAVRAVDLDNDGLMDVVSTSLNDNKVAWYRRNSNGSYGVQQVITSSDPFPTGLEVTDMNNDGKPDVVWASWFGNKISWARNLSTPGNISFAAPQILTTQTVSPWTVIAVDLDGDGIKDLVTGSLNNHSVEWYKGNGNGTVGVKRLLTTQPDSEVQSPVSLSSGDIDGDGLIDVVGCYAASNKVVWFRNLGGPGYPGNTTFATRQIIANQILGVYSVLAADVNGDGKVDVLTASLNDNKISWFQNLGAGTFGDPDTNRKMISSDTAAAYSVAVGDFNQDGVMDVASASQDDSKVATYINRGGQTAVSTSDVAPAVILDGQRKAMLRVDLSSRGVAGNNNARLDSLSLLFEASPGVPLTTAQANALIDNLYIYADTNNSGSYEAGSDLSIALIPSLTLNAGKFTAVVSSNLPLAQIAPGTTRSFFVVPQLAANASSQAPNAFRITNVMQGSGNTTARDAFSSELLSAEVPAVPSVASSVTTATTTTNGNLIVAAGESKGTTGGVYNSIVIGAGGTLTLSTSGTSLVVAPGESKSTSGGVYDSIVIGNGGTLTLTTPAPTPSLTTQSLDSWRSVVFTASELNNVQVSGPLADFDGDGLNTLMEFALNLNPKVSDKTTMTAGTGVAGRPLIHIESVAGQQRLTAEFVRRRAAGAPGISYVMEFSSDLSNPAAWSSSHSTQAVTQIDGTWERVKVTDSQSASPIRYGRLKVTMP